MNGPDGIEELFSAVRGVVVGLGSQRKKPWRPYAKQFAGKFAASLCRNMDPQVVPLDDGD